MIVFVLEIGGQPTVAFEATSLREARELCKEEWMRVDLASFRSKGLPLWDGNAGLTIKRADEVEEARYREAANLAESDSGDMVLAYLVDLDGDTVH